MSSSVGMGILSVMASSSQIGLLVAHKFCSVVAQTSLATMAAMLMPELVKDKYRMSPMHHQRAFTELLNV